MDIRIAADSTMFLIVNLLIALSFGVQREQLEHRIGLTWPRPFLLRPLLCVSMSRPPEIQVWSVLLGRPLLDHFCGDVSCSASLCGLADGCVWRSRMTGEVELSRSPLPSIWRECGLISQDFARLSCRLRKSRLRVRVGLFTRYRGALLLRTTPSCDYVYYCFTSNCQTLTTAGSGVIFHDVGRWHIQRNAERQTSNWLLG